VEKRRSMTRPFSVVLDAFEVALAISFSPLARSLG